MAEGYKMRDIFFSYTRRDVSGVKKLHRHPCFLHTRRPCSRDQAGIVLFAGSLAAVDAYG